MQDKGSNFSSQPDDIKIARINQLMAMQTYQENLDYVIGKCVTSEEMKEFQAFSNAQAEKVAQNEHKD